jgi:hypothetical protein
METIRNIKRNRLKEKVELHVAISDVERFLMDYKIENKSKWKSFENTHRQIVNEARNPGNPKNNQLIQNNKWNNKYMIF